MKRLLLLVFSFLCISSTHAQSVTIYRLGVALSPSYSTLNDAVINSTSGDSLVLSASMFKENAIYIDKSLILTGTITSGAKTMIDGLSTRSPSSVIIFGNPSYLTTTNTLYIKDIEIRNGMAMNGGAKGGGAIYAQEGTKLILDGETNIVKNEARGMSPAYIGSPYGGGIYSDGDVILKGRTQISFNSAQMKGGGVYCTQSLQVLENVIINNNNSNKGGGIYTLGDLLIKDSALIKSNWGGSDGGGIYSSSNCTIQGNSKIESNGSNSKGGAIYSIFNLTLSQNAIIDSNFTNGNGGGIYIEGNGLIKDSAIIIFNKAISGAGIFASSAYLGLKNKVVLAANESKRFGAAMTLVNSKFAMRDSVAIALNITDSNAASGIYCIGRDSVNISGGQIIGNHAKDSSIKGQGMAIYIDSISSSYTYARVNNVRIFNPAADTTRQNEIYQLQRTGTFLSDSTWWGNSDTSNLIFTATGSSFTMPSWIIANWKLNGGLPVSGLDSFALETYFTLNSGVAIPSDMFWMLQGRYFADSGTFVPIIAYMTPSNIINTFYHVPMISGVVNLLGVVDMDSFKIAPSITGLGLPQNKGAIEVGFIVYPNPSNGVITISFSAIPKSLIRTKIYDLLGHIVYQQNLNFIYKETSIKLNIPNGSYILELQDEAGNAQRERILVQ